MKLNELLGYRDSSAYDQAHSPLSQFHLYLLDNGFRRLGRGAYAAVYEHPNLNYCIKIFNQDDGYRQFLNLVAQHKDNVHFPKFRGKIIKVGMTKAVRMEKLKECDINGMYLIFYLRSLFLNFNSGLTSEEKQKAEDTLGHQPSFKDTFELVVKNKGKMALDLHDGNVMMRADGTYVITDPYTT